MTKKAAIKAYCKMFIKCGKLCNDNHSWTPEECILFNNIYSNIMTKKFKFQQYKKFYQIYTSSPLDRLFIDRFVAKHEKLLN